MLKKQTYAHRIPSLMRSRPALILAFCLVCGVGAMLLLPVSSARSGSTGWNKTVSAAEANPAPQTPTGTEIIQGTYDPQVYPCATPKHRFSVGAGKSRIVIQLNAETPTNDLSVSPRMAPNLTKT